MLCFNVPLDVLRQTVCKVSYKRCHHHRQTGSSHIFSVVYLPVMSQVHSVQVQVQVQVLRWQVQVQVQVLRNSSSTSTSTSTSQI